MHTEGDHKFLKALESIDFLNRYKSISDNYQFEMSDRLHPQDPKIVGEILKRLSYEAKYFKRERFFQLWASGSSYNAALNLNLRMSLDLGRLDLLLAPVIDGNVYGGSIHFYPKRFGLDPIPRPGFRCYQEFEEVFGRLIVVVEDMQQVLLPIADIKD
ncbi:hypothetical protein [Allohahella sp. A8]|uniref:hypothetical protein n=1 Tax=Allohahella sp. A8 TaxID=3141461 RepID=UPI003A806B30